MYGKTQRTKINTTSNNPLYASFWDQQTTLRNQLLQEQARREKSTVSELDKYKNDQIQKVQAEVKEYERTHGQSGNFWKDFKYGVVSANNSTIKPFLKYTKPVLSMTPIGASASSAVEGLSGVVDRLA
jgi:hypothetical protein